MLASLLVKPPFGCFESQLIHLFWLETIWLPRAKDSANCPTLKPTADKAPSHNACCKSPVHSEFVYPSASVEFSKAFIPNDAAAVIVNTAREPPPVNGAAMIAPIIIPMFATIIPLLIVLT